MDSILPFQQSPTTLKPTTQQFYGQGKKRDIPKHALRFVNLTDYEKSRLRRDANWVNFDDGKYCSYYHWEVPSHYIYDYVTLKVGETSCSSDSICIKYDIDGEAKKIVYYTDMIHGDYSNRRETNATLDLPNNKIKTLRELLDYFKINMGSYSYPVDNLVWENSYRLVID